MSEPIKVGDKMIVRRHCCPSISRATPDVINDELMHMQDQTERELSDAIERSGLDISLCRGCGKLVVCIPDGLSNICEACAEKESK